MSRLKIGPAVLSIYKATVDDLELLAVAEDEFAPEQEEYTDGQGGADGV